MPELSDCHSDKSTLDRTTSAVEWTGINGTLYPSHTSLGSLLFDSLIEYEKASYRVFVYLDRYDDKDVFYVTTSSPRAIGWGYDLDTAYDMWKEDFLTEMNPVKKWLKQGRPSNLAPGEIVKRIEQGSMSAPQLVNAIESLANTDDGFVVVTLKQLLAHDSSIVREAAVEALGAHGSDDVLELLREIAHGDPSPGVRQAAQDVID